MKVSVFAELLYDIATKFSHVELQNQFHCFVLVFKWFTLCTLLIENNKAKAGICIAMLHFQTPWKKKALFTKLRVPAKQLMGNNTFWKKERNLSTSQTFLISSEIRKWTFCLYFTKKLLQICTGGPLS